MKKKVLAEMRNVAPVSKKLNDQVAHQLGIDIIANRYPPGSILPNEEEASALRGVSRTAYREALRILATKGLVSSRPKTGTRVNPRADWVLLDPDVLKWMFECEPSQEFIKGLFELRMIIEPTAAAFAAQRRTSKQLSEMGYAIESMARFGLQKAEGRDADEAFHRLILQATGNEALAALTNSISAAIRWTTILKYKARNAPRDPLPPHRALFEAIASRNAEEARAATTTLIQRALEDTKKSLERKS